MKAIYLLITLLGMLFPYAAFVPWLIAHGADIPLLWDQATANPISIFAWTDVIISATALLVFIVTDSIKNTVKYSYLAVLGTLVVGVSFGLPLYLYLRERHAEDKKTTA